ncbi:MAG: Gfo/Idh/MocA family oxidoreductase [Anaerolineae bacterium]|nr:Gfo/Idh/MocA family oxidoreductase [Anaerolineae bacterium]
MNTHDLLRFAVVGVKGYSRSHLRFVQHLADVGRGRLGASMMIDMADHPDVVDAFTAARVRVYGDYQAMLDGCRGAVDVVTLPVPIYLHAPMTVAALEAGYHVLVEKPVAGSLDEVDRMIRARQESGRQCAVGFQQIYSPVFQGLKQLIVEGRLGPVHEIRIIALWPRDPAYYGRNEWAGRLTCGGRPVFDSPFNNALAHQIMNMLYLASPERGRAAQVVHVDAELYRAYDIESFDTGCMRAHTDSGADVLFAATHACAQTLNPIMQLVARDARVDWQIGGNATVRYADGRYDEIEEGAPHTHMIENIADAVTGAVDAPHCTLEVGRAHVACIDALHRAAQIRTVPPARVSTLAGGQRVIAGVEDAIRRVYDTGQLFSELGVELA